ncbi:MAG: hypothetical protein ACLPJH_08745 [Myxococcaceae bacterium]
MGRLYWVRWSHFLHHKLRKHWQWDLQFSDVRLQRDLHAAS